MKSIFIISSAVCVLSVIACTGLRTESGSYYGLLKPEQMDEKTDKLTDKLKSLPAKPAAESVKQEPAPEKTTPQNTTVTQTQNNTSPKIVQDAWDGNKWNIAALDTARSASYLSDLEKDIILELNMVRSDPGKYADLYINPTLGEEEAGCYFSLIRSPDARPLLFPKKGMSQAAKDHAADIGPKGKIDHSGSDGSSPETRMNRYGTVSKWSENIAYGYSTARQIVVELLVDAGIFNWDKGHRRAILNPEYLYAGIATGPHASYKIVCVQDFAAVYTEK